MLNTICKTCGTTFIASNLSHKYCKPECRKSFVVRPDYTNFRNLTKTCPCCHSSFTFDKSNYTKIYCSSDCRLKFIKDSNTEKSLKRLNEDIPCVNCSTKFKYKPYRAGRKFCNEECRKSYYRSKKVGESFNCLMCDKVLEYDPRKSARKFCDAKCRVQHHTKTEQRATHEFIETRVRDIFERMRVTKVSIPFGINISEATLSSFTDTIKQQVLDRDNTSCQVCGVSIGRLEVHHILKRRLGGSNESSNLITLCVKCHRAIDTYDEEYAVTKCVKNFDKLFDAHNEYLTNQQKVTSSSFLLSEVFERLSSEGTSLEYSDLLIKIDGLLTYLDD